jgi:hypothetical protein
MDTQKDFQVAAHPEYPLTLAISLCEMARVRGFSLQIISGNESRILSSVIGYSRTLAPVAL